MSSLNQEKLQKVLKWVCEELRSKPNLTRKEAFRKAEISFDLSPKECEFIERNFTEPIS